VLKSHTMAETPNSVQVEIFGQVYSVRAGASPGYVERLAAQVDEQMRDVSRSAGVVDSLRVAVLAALNLADEAARASEELRVLRERAASMANALKGVVEDSSK
jgi:cell division protein ZapA